jgi:hypothetical protein
VIKLKKDITLILILVVLISLIALFMFSSPIFLDVINKITGKTVTTAYIYETPPENCSVELYEGMNLVSFHCETGVGTINESFANASNNSLNYSYFFRYNPANRNDSWDSYNPSLPEWVVQGFDRLNRKEGYYVFMNENGTYFKEGLKFTTTSIRLHSGWNYVGYPSKEIRNVTSALESIKNDFTQVVTYNGSWLNYDNSTGGGTLEYFVPGNGYWINVTKDVYWVLTWED